MKKIEELYVHWTKRQPLLLTRRALHQLVGDRPHQGVVLDSSPLEFAPIDYLPTPSTLSQRVPLWVALDEIQDPQNFGAILRSCAYFGVEGITTSEKARCPLTPTVSKASAGAMEWITVYEAHSFIAFLQASKEKGWKVLGTTSYSARENIAQSTSSPMVDLRTLSLSEPYLVVFGNEGSGIRKIVREQCDVFVTIPPHKSTVIPNNTPFSLDSLNVSAAAAIVLYHLRKTV